MTKTTTISVGIPAFNEEATMQNLLNDIVSQKSKNYMLSEIIISSDGSTDNTNNIVESHKDKRIKLIKNHGRKGIARGLNQICKVCKGDVLVILNADIRINNRKFIDQIAKPIVDGHADLVSCRIKEGAPKNFFERVLKSGADFRKIVFEKYNKGDNLYTCHGLARAFSKKLYSKINFKTGVGEDMYSYLYAKKCNFIYKYLSAIFVEYKLPDNFTDHGKQSVRYMRSLTNMRSYFGNAFVNKHNTWPIGIFFEEGIKSFIKSPANFTLYPVIYFIFKIKSMFSHAENVESWPIVKSSKNTI